MVESALNPLLNGVSQTRYMKDNFWHETEVQNWLICVCFYYFCERRIYHEVIHKRVS